MMSWLMGSGDQAQMSALEKETFNCKNKCVELSKEKYLMVEDATSQMVKFNKQLLKDKEIV